MLDIKFCHNHPNGKAIAACHKCAIDLCGICSSYVDDIVLCEHCVEIYENEKYVSAQSEILERPKSTLVVDDEQAEAFSLPPGRKKTNRAVPIIVIGLCACVIAVQLYLYSNPERVEQDPVALAQEQAIASLVQCMLVFREIGLILQDGRMPDDSAICADSPAANSVSNEDGALRIYHPNPQNYGYAEISVSAVQAEPRLVRAEP